MRIASVLLLFISFQANAQLFHIGDTASLYEDKRPGQIIIESKKIGSISYARYSENVDIGMFLEKRRDLANGPTIKGISFEGYLTSTGFYSSNSEFCQGIVWDDELTKFINGLAYINDSLLPTTPKDKVFYAINLETSNLRVSASFNPYDKGFLSDKNVWCVYFDFNRYSSRGFFKLKNIDCKILIDVLKKEKEELKRF